MAASLQKETDRFSALLLAGSLITLWVSGVILLFGSWLPWLFDLHRIAGFLLIISLVIKTATLLDPARFRERELKTRKVDSLIATIFTGWLLIISALGLVWMWRLGPYSSFHQTLITWHWILGVLLLPVLTLQVLLNGSRPPKPFRLGRRSFLKLLGTITGSILLARLGTSLAEAQATPDSPRRFTGSRGFGIFSGNDFPTTGESTVVVDLTKWRLVIGGAVLSPLRLYYQDIVALQSETVLEAIDCHNGWYSLQEWQGVTLASLLEMAGLQEKVSGVRLVSATGLSNTYPIQEARQILLATHVSGEVLDAAHGFPLRAVVPGRRGWFWLKWLTEVEVLDQPFEVLIGILCTPLQVFRELEHPRSSSEIP